MTLTFYHDDCAYVVEGFASDFHALSWTQQLMHDGAVIVDHNGTSIIITSEGSRSFRLTGDGAIRLHGARYVKPKGRPGSGEGETQASSEKGEENRILVVGDVPVTAGSFQLPGKRAARERGRKDTSQSG